MLRIRVLPAIPTPEDVARVALITDRVARDREVTRGCSLLSQRLRESLGDEISWPTPRAGAAGRPRGKRSAWRSEVVPTLRDVQLARRPLADDAVHETVLAADAPRPPTGEISP